MLPRFPVGCAQRRDTLPQPLLVLSVAAFRKQIGVDLVGIDVVIVAPGSVATPIGDKTDAAPSDHLAGTMWERPHRAFRNTMGRNGRKGLAPDASARS